MSTENQYAERDAMWLDQQGGHYIRHIDRMTHEELHSKSDIAAELGWRDYQIAELGRQVSALQTSQDNIINGLGIKGDGPLSKLVLEKFIALQAKCDVLAAENACLKQDIDTIAEVMETGTDGALFSAIDEAVSINTPATDLVLARIKAQGVDELIQSLSVNGYMDESEPHIQGEIVEFAANLRAGRKG